MSQEKKTDIKKVIPIYFPQWVYDWLKAESNKTGIAMSNLVKALIIKEMEKNDSKNLGRY